MKQFRKRTIALVLASVVTVVGAFGAENYKNSLMSLKFDSGSNGAVSVTLQTKRNYEQTITPIKKDATTYVIMLPETNSQMSANPELAGDVESVNVRTMPYTTSSKGYTKITIRTSPNVMLTAQKALYIPEKKKTAASGETAQNTTDELQEVPKPENIELNDNTERPKEDVVPIRSRSGVDQTNPVDIKKSVQQFEPNESDRIQKNISPQNNSATLQSNLPETSDSSTSDILLLILGIVLVIILCVFFYIKAKDKMTAIVGEQPDFSDDEAENKKKEAKNESKRKQIKTAINKLDKMYSKPTKMPVNDIQIESQVKTVHNPVEEIEPQVDNIVDLDELFQEKTNTSEVKVDTIDNLDEENNALEEFLSGFSFNESHFLENEEEQHKNFNEELYEKYINDQNLKFSKSDIKKIEELLNSEISDETMKDIKSFVVTNPIEKKPSKRELLENFVTTYTINQNVSFSNADIDALNKLMSVELDNDFITDLKTNPKRLDEMRQEIEKQNTKPHKSSELLTLNVKDMLPDLSEALKKQGGRKIESEAKPQVVYYSEGYDVSTLSLKDELPDLTIEINKDYAYESRPSDEIELAESGYDVDTMRISDDLPDLNDALIHPEKYEEEKSTIEVDEEALLKNISDISFKPFYEENTTLEISNNDNDDLTSPQILDEQKIIDLHEEASENIIQGEVSSEPPQNSENKNKPLAKNRSDSEADKLLKFIEEKKQKQENQILEKEVKIIDEAPKEDVSKEKDNDIKTFILDNEIYQIVSKSSINDKFGCYLVKNNSGYYIMGFVQDKVFKIKSYKQLQNEKLQTRLSEKLNDGTTRYIVRVGIHKFILNVKDDNMEYVMDLC